MTDLSFVVPAFNEARCIGRTIASIHEHTPSSYTYEIIVIDHGSTDATREIARGKGAIVIEGDSKFVSGLRNMGAEIASGRYLVFLDADVLLTARWSAALPEALYEIDRVRNTLTGANCNVPRDATWIERNWFAPQVRSTTSHIGSAHMIISADDFRRLGRFDATLETGEDYELCQRVLLNGGRIRVNAALDTIHLGYPRTIKAFLRREAWHGRGDFKNVQNVAKSRVALAALVFGLSHLVAILGIGLRSYVLMWFGLTMIAGICATSSVVRFRTERAAIQILNVAIYYLYFSARFTSALLMVRDVSPRRVERS